MFQREENQREEKGPPTEKRKKKREGSAVACGGEDSTSNRLGVNTSNPVTALDVVDAAHATNFHVF